MEKLNSVKWITVQYYKICFVSIFNLVIMPIYCATCSRNITQERFPGVKCGSCEKVFHIKCLGLSAEMTSNIIDGSSTWLFPTCRSSSTRKSVIDYNAILDPEIPANPTLHDVMAALSNVQQKLNDLERSQQFISSNVDQLNSKVSALTSENRSMKSKLKHMENQIYDYDRKLSWLEDKIDLPNQMQNLHIVVV